MIICIIRLGAFDMYIDHVKKKSADRFRRVIRSDHKNVDTNLIILLEYLNKNPITSSILNELKATKAYDEGWDPKFGRGIGASIKDLNLPTNDLDRAAVILSILENCVEEPRRLEGIGFNIRGNGNIDSNVSYFNQTFTKILYEFIDERFEDGNLILYLLNRFKARCEWFYKKELCDLYLSDPSRGEKLLSKELRKFLFDQGIDYPFSEPETPSGKPDLVHGIDGSNPLTLEIKLFEPSSKKRYGRGYIRKGFRQAFDYSDDYNQPYGYLLVFNLSDYNIKFTSKNGSKPTKIEFGDKTIFIVVVNLFDDSKSSSQKRKLKPYEITDEYLKSE